MRWQAAPLLVAVASGLAWVAGAAEPKLDVRLEPNRLGVEDIAQLTVSVTEPGGVVGGPELGELDNFQVVAGPSTEKQFSWANGVATTTLGFTYHLQPLRVGPATVGAIRIEIGDTVLTSEPIGAEVVPGSVAASRRSRRLPVNPFDPFADVMVRRPRREGKIALRQLVSDRKVFLGEPVVATVVLDSTMSGVEGFEFATSPSYPGWWAQRVERDGPIVPEVVEWEGEQYNRYVVARHLLVPLKAGTLTLPPVMARIGTRGRSIFAPQQVVERESEELEVEVNERPRAPEGFSGAVGSLRYRASLEQSAIEYGESTVLTVELSGTGNLPMVEAPSQWPTCSACETYPPEEESRVTMDQSGIHGTRTWRMTVVPRQWGALQLEPVTLAVFDPGAGHYRRQTVGPLALQVAAPLPTPTPQPRLAAVRGEPGEAPDEDPPAAAAGPLPRSWLLVTGALVMGLLVGGLATWLVSRRRVSAIPPRKRGQSPAERARELHLALERWWLGIDESARTAGLRAEVDAARSELEVVRFAPGRADHSQTISNLEERCRGLARKA